MSFLSFPHRHNVLAPISSVEKTEDDSRQQCKRRPWKSRIIIPDYRKTKIGEYQEKGKGERENGDGVSDVESTSSDDSGNSNKTVSSQEKSSSPEEIKICTGCERLFSSTTPSTPVSTSQQQDRHRRNPFILKCNTQDLNKFSSTNRYRCMWPGCSLVVCSECELLLRKRREQGGAYGNLQRLREIWASTMEAEKSKQGTLVPLEVIRPYDKFSQARRTDCLILTTPIPATDGPQIYRKSLAANILSSVLATDTAADSKENSEANRSRGGIIVQTVEVVVDKDSIPVTAKVIAESPSQETMSRSVPSTEMSTKYLVPQTPA